MNFEFSEEQYEFLEQVDRFLEENYDPEVMASGAPAEEIELSARAALLDQMRTTLARLRQAGMATDELLAIIHLELEVLDGAKRENDDE